MAGKITGAMRRIFENKRRFIAVGIVIALVIVLPIIMFLIQNQQDLRQRASGGTVLVSSNIPSGTRSVGDEFYADITLDTQSNKASAFDITLQYNSNVLTANGVVASTPFTHVINQVNDSAGTIRLVAISKIPVSGSVTVGKVAFRAKNPGSSDISYNNIKVAALGSGSSNIPTSQTTASVTVGTGATATPTPTTTMCAGGLANCANDTGSNYSCAGTPIYIGNSLQDNWCRNNGGAGSREWCWKCVTSTSTVTPTCTFNPTNVLSVTAGIQKSFSINASNLQSGTTLVGFTSGTDKLFRDFGNNLPLNSTMSITTANSSYTNSSAGGNQTFTFNINTTPLTPSGDYTLDAIYLSNSGNKTQCIYSGLGGLVINVKAPAGTKTCYKDGDGDGYGNASGGTLTNQTSCSSGWSLNSNDCYDQNPNANPGQTEYFGTHRGDNSFDYNCSNGVIEKKYPVHTFGSQPTAKCEPTPPPGRVNFTNDTECGAFGTFRTCLRWATTACGGVDTRNDMSDETGQLCPTNVSGNGWALVDQGSVQQLCR